VDFGEARDDRVAVAPAGPHANHLHLSPVQTSTPPQSFRQSDILPASQPTASKH